MLCHRSFGYLYRDRSSNNTMDMVEGAAEVAYAAMEARILAYIENGLDYISGELGIVVDPASRAGLARAILRKALQYIIRLIVWLLGPRDNMRLLEQ